MDNLIDTRNVLSKDSDLDEDTLQKLAYELLSRQFLLREKSHQRRYFNLVCRHQTYFRRLMKATNHQLIIEENRGFVGIIPIDFTRQMTLDETLILLALRNIYDEEIHNFNAMENGSIELPIADFKLKYETMTGRELPQNKTDFLSLIKPLIRFGVVKERKEPENNDIWLLHIYPTITALVSGDALKLIEAHMKATDIDTQEAEEAR